MSVQFISSNDLLYYFKNRKTFLCYANLFPGLYLDSLLKCEQYVRVTTEWTSPHYATVTDQ